VFKAHPIIEELTAEYNGKVKFCEAKCSGELGIRYVHMEAGHVGQNLYLQAVARGLGMVVVGAFYDDQVQKILRLPADHKPLYLIPVGRPK